MSTVRPQSQKFKDLLLTSVITSIHGCRAAAPGFRGRCARGLFLARSRAALRQPTRGLQAHRFPRGRSRGATDHARSAWRDIDPGGPGACRLRASRRSAACECRRALAHGAERRSERFRWPHRDPGTYLLPGLLARFHEERPAVQLDVRLSTSGGSLDLVRSHEVELAVVGGMTVPPELESEPLVEDEVVLVGAPSLGRRRLRQRSSRD